MKKYIYILFAAALTLMLSACQQFLTRDNLTSLDDVIYWRSEQNVRLCVNGAYGDYFTGYSDNWGQVNAPGVYSAGEYSDDYTSSGVQRNILLSVPADNWYRAESTPYRGVWLARRAGAAWNFAYVRKWILLMNRLNTMKEGNYLNDEEYNHWMGVARFTRGWESLDRKSVV